MTEPVDNEVVDEVARGLVAQTAPQELPLFRATSEAYFADPDQVLAGKEDRDEMLGFGAEAVVTLVTPVALEVAKTVVGYLATQLVSVMEQHAGEAIATQVRKLFHRDTAGADAPPPLTSDQLARVRDLALEKARQLNLADNQAHLLADAMVGSLSLDAAERQ
jgi:hypothetical protein